MLWDDPAFRDDYRARLRHAHTSSDAEAQAQTLAFRAEAAKAGGFSREHFIARAGAASAATLSGYVRGALDAFDQAVAAIEAEFEESDLNALRASLEQEIARRAKALPATLRDFSRPAPPAAMLRTILEQAPVKARQLLSERLSAARSRVQTRVNTQKSFDRALFLVHDARDAALAEALKRTISAAVGDDVALYTSSELESLRTSRDGFDRVLTQLKKNRLTLALVTPDSIGDASLWWMVGVAEGAAKPVFVLAASGVSAGAALPLREGQVIELARRDDVVRLLQLIQGEVRRRPTDPAELDLTDVIGEASRETSDRYEQGLPTI